MMEHLTVGLGERAYPIWIGHGILQHLDKALREVHFPNRVALVTNPAVYDLFGETVRQVLEGAGFTVSVILLAEGEENKNLQTLQTIYDALIREGFDRTSGLIALGGGVIGDMTGFAAATFLRGVPFVQVPTRCWPRWTARWEARQPSITRSAKILSGPSTSPVTSILTWRP